jgi:hypothetical protein
MKKTITAYAPQTIEDEHGRYEQDSYGDWTGWAGARRTMLKSTLVGAQMDVQNRRFVCQCWPDCRHQAPK